MDRHFEKKSIIEQSLKNHCVIIMNRINSIRTSYDTRDLDHWAKEISNARRELAEIQRILMYLENTKKGLR